MVNNKSGISRSFGYIWTPYTAYVYLPQKCYMYSENSPTDKTQGL